MRDRARARARAASDAALVASGADAMKPRSCSPKRASARRPRRAPNCALLPKLGMRIERQVVGEQVDAVRQQQRQARLQPAGQAPVLAAPEQAVVHQDRVGAASIAASMSARLAVTPETSLLHLRPCPRPANRSAHNPETDRRPAGLPGVDSISLRSAMTVPGPMRRTWLIFSQAVTVAVAVLFVVATLKPEWLRRAPAPACRARSR